MPTVVERDRRAGAPRNGKPAGTPRRTGRRGGHDGRRRVLPSPAAVRRRRSPLSRGEATVEIGPGRGSTLTARPMLRLRWRPGGETPASSSSRRRGPEGWRKALADAQTGAVTLICGGTQEAATRPLDTGRTGSMLRAARRHREAAAMTVGQDTRRGGLGRSPHSSPPWLCRRGLRSRIRTRRMGRAQGSAGQDLSPRRNARPVVSGEHSAPGSTMNSARPGGRVPAGLGQDAEAGLDRNIWGGSQAAR